MPELVAGARDRSPNDGEPPSSAGLVLRPFGYLLIGSVWLSIWLIAVGLLVGSVAFLAFDDPEALLTGGQGGDTVPVGQAITLVVSAVFLAAIIGPGGWHVLTASWPLAVLSFVYALRSLRPSYAGEKLSFTAHGFWGSTFGPPTVGEIALSLQPVRPTRFTDRVMRFYMMGWGWNGRMLLAVMPAGLAWSTAIGALMPGIPGIAHVIFWALTVVLLGTSLVLGVRVFRAGPPAERSAEVVDVSVADLSAEERAKRLKQLTKQRAKRVREG